VIIKSRLTPVLQVEPNNCEGELVLFTDKSQNTPGFEIITRSWDFGDGESTSSASAVITHRYKNAGSYQIKLVLKSTQNCISETTEQTIKISAKPIPEFDLPDICVTDGTATFINKSKPGNGETTGLTYTWHFNDDNATAGNPDVSTLTNPGHLFTAAKAYTISLTVTSSNGCDSTVTKTFTVNSSPKAGFKILNPQSVCSGEQVFLKDLSTVANVGTITRLVWYFNAEEDLTDKLEIIHPQTGQIYSHTYTQFYGPVASVPRRIKLVAYSGEKCYDEYSENINLFAMPKLQFDQLNDICADAGPIQITGAKEITGLTGGTATFTGPGTSANGVFYPDRAGVGLHTLTYHFVTGSGCASSISRQINVLETPDAALPSEVYILKGNDLILKPAYRGQNLSYRWSPAISIDDYAIANPRVAPVSTTAYQVEVSNGVCTAYAQINVKVLLPPIIYNTFTPNGDGINDLWEIPNLKDYPKATVSIFNRYGIKLYGSTGYSQPWNGQYNGRDVPSGTYYYIVIPGNGQKTYSGNVTIIR